MIKPFYNYLRETMIHGKTFITFISSLFVLLSYQILTLTYDHGYLQLLMLNNGKRRIIYVDKKLVFFVMINYTIMT